MLFIGAALFIAVLSQAQTNLTQVPNLLPPIAPATSVSNLLGTAASGVSQAASDGWNVFSQFSLTNPISAGIVGLKNGNHYGGGIEVSTANTNSLVNIGFGLFAIQNDSSSTVNGVTKTKTQWGFYDATINLSVSTVEQIPILKIPITLKIESGPAVRLSRGGGTLLEQSAAFGDVTFDQIKNWPITVGAGIVDCSAFANVMPMLHLNISHQF